MEHSRANGCLLIWLAMLMINSYCFGLCRGCLEEEKTVLLQIRDSMGYLQPQSSSLLSSWSPVDCCQWEWVACSPTSSHVTRIFLYSAREADQHLPWFPDLSLFAKLPELQELDLGGNKIGGLVAPEALCRLPTLQLLDLSYNSIQGELPPCWGNMPSLRSLNLTKNQFGGNLSSVFSNLTNIETIDVSYNHFQGPVPFSSFAHLSKLRYLDLSQNHIEVETETPAWQPSFQLQHLSLACCKLNHQSDFGVPSFISNQHNLQTLDLSGNLLTGPVPIWMLHNVSAVLRLQNNVFSGKFPQGYRDVASPLVELDISCNYFEGPLPLNINALFPHLYKLNVSTNGLRGAIPPSLGELNNLQYLDLSNNHLVGQIPGRLTEISSLWYLNLSNNSLHGELLPQDCNMQQLKWLLLHDNHFVGSMPLCLSKSPSLMILDARNNNLSRTVSKLPIFPLLRALLLGGNQIEGYIPMQLCQMQNIQFLDLSKNFFSGSVPSCLKKNLVWRKKSQSSSWVPVDFTTKGNSYSFQGLPLTLMTGIDLSANNLSGIIPSEIGELQELHSLNLSHNHLSGPIPRSFGKLKSLESLDLSHNKLTGPIPSDIAQLDSLSTFSVAFNNLSGMVPFDKHLSTFTELSYVGNPDLCGEPLQKKCSAEGDQDVDDHNKEGHREENGIIDEPMFFYSWVAVSYALGFWSVIAPLFFNKNWRRRYFAAVEKYIDLCFKKLYESLHLFSSIKTVGEDALQQWTNPTTRISRSSM